MATLLVPHPDSGVQPPLYLLHGTLGILFLKQVGKLLFTGKQREMATLEEGDEGQTGESSPAFLVF